MVTRETERKVETGEGEGTSGVTVLFITSSGSGTG
jgi:hypothetical protein